MSLKNYIYIYIYTSFVYLYIYVCNAAGMHFSVLAITASSQRSKYCEQYCDTGNDSLLYFVIFV